MIMQYVYFGTDIYSCIGISGFSSVCAALLLVAAAALLLKSLGFKGAPVFVAVCVVGFISWFGEAFGEIGATFSEISSYADITEYASAAMKVVGIGYLSGISSDICREIGEAGVAKCIGVVSKLELVMIAAPFIRDILSLSFDLIGG